MINEAIGIGAADHVKRGCSQCCIQRLGKIHDLKMSGRHLEARRWLSPLRWNTVRQAAACAAVCSAGNFMRFLTHVKVSGSARINMARKLMINQVAHGGINV